MEYFELTRDMMANAKTYMPLQTKKELAETIAHGCVRPMDRLKWDGIHLSPRADKDEGKNDPTALPDLMEEDISLKMCMLQNVLLLFLSSDSWARTSSLGSHHPTPFP